MFKITAGKGFHVTFANGWTVSVQWGPGNYAEHHMARGGDDYTDRERRCGKQGSATAEVACWPRDGHLVNLGDDTVRGWQTPEQVLALMVEVAGLPADATELPSVGGVRVAP